MLANFDATAKQLNGINRCSFFWSSRLICCLPFYILCYIVLFVLPFFLAASFHLMAFLSASLPHAHCFCIDFHASTFSRSLSSFAHLSLLFSMCHSIFYYVATTRTKEIWWSSWTDAANCLWQVIYVFYMSICNVANLVFYFYESTYC